MGAVGRGWVQWRQWRQWRYSYIPHMVQTAVGQRVGAVGWGGGGGSGGTHTCPRAAHSTSQTLPSTSHSAQDLHL